MDIDDCESAPCFHNATCEDKVKVTFMILFLAFLKKFVVKKISSNYISFSLSVPVLICQCL